MDDLEWEQHRRELDEVVRAHRDRPLPDRLLANHHRLFMAKMRADHVELARLVVAHPHIDWRL